MTEKSEPTGIDDGSPAETETPASPEAAVATAVAPQWRDTIPEATDGTPSRTAVGVSFRRSGKVYYFATAEVDCRIGDRVIAATEKGVDIGEVVEFRPNLGDRDAPPLKPLLRKATPQDIAREDELHEREKEVLRVCEERVAEHKLPMKLIEADYSFDGQRLVIFFSAEGRVDFRGLVRDLAEAFRCRIELRQIGVRDEAKMIGGYGPCGRALCCTTFLRNFEAVGIRVAKDQGLALNPAKISGVCDRLMCCLKYEHEVYRHLSSKLPKIGARIETPKGEGTVRHIHLLKSSVIAQLGDGEYIEVCLGEAPPTRRPGAEPLADYVESEPVAAAVFDAAAEPAPSEAPVEGAREEGRRRRPRRDRRGKPREGQGQAASAKPAPFVPPSGAGQPPVEAGRPAPSTPKAPGAAGEPTTGAQPGRPSRRSRRQRGGDRRAADKAQTQGTPTESAPSGGQGEKQGGLPRPFRPPTKPAATGAAAPAASQPTEKPAEGGEPPKSRRRGGRPYYRRRGGRGDGGGAPGGSGAPEGGGSAPSE